MKVRLQFVRYCSVQERHVISRPSFFAAAFFASQTAMKPIPYPPWFVQVSIYRQRSSRHADDSSVVGFRQGQRWEHNIVVDI